MATDRKPRRTSSPDEKERSSKRHKLRHHHHSRRHRHRHGSKKHEQTKHENEIDAASALAIPPSGVRKSETVSHQQDDDVEEGEILEEDGLSDDIEKKVGDSGSISDSDSGEWKMAGSEDVQSDKLNMKHLVEETPSGHLNESVRTSASNSRTKGYDVSNVPLTTNVGSDGKEKDLCSDSMVELAVNFGSYSMDHDHGNHISFHRPVSPNDGGRHHKQCDDDELDIVRSKSILHRYSSSESTGDKHNTSRSHHKHHDEYVYMSPTRSRSHARERSLSHSTVEEDSHGRKRLSDEGANFVWAEKRKTKYVVDDRSRESRHRSRDIEERSASFSCRYNGMEDRHRSKERSDRERSTDGDRDLRRRRKRERSMEMDIDRVHRREKEGVRSKDRDVGHGHHRERDQERRLEKERRIDEDRGRSRERDRNMDWRAENGRSRSRDTERERRRDKERYSRRDKERDRSSDARLDRDRRMEKDVNRSRERERDAWRDGDRERERDQRDWYREITKDREMHNSKNSRNSRLDETKYFWDRKRHPELEKAHNFSSNSVKEREDKQKREEVEHEEFDENVALKFSDQEEDDLNKIKEESRRRREAILEKYKMQKLQQPTDIESQALEKDMVPVEGGDGSPDNLDDRVDDVDVCVEEASFSVGKSPPRNGNVVPGRSSGAGGLGEGTSKSERSDDKFCDDIFGDTPTGVRKTGTEEGMRIERSGLNDNWDDAEGYYGYRFGEILDGRYEVTAAHGKGVFSTVVRARNLRPGNGEPDEVAIKIIRNNDTMYKAGMDELVILKKLVGADPDNKRHCVRFLSSFKYRNHLCLVFESLQMNLREVLKKFGRNIGLRLTAVRAYSKQLFIALKHLRNCGVLHCDIKPDNMLVNEAKNVLKLCDFGNAMFAGKNEVTPYLVSRFYRAPEIILGLQYDHPLDMWSVGCCLYELYTGKVLFPGPTNNDMLRLQMELKGTFPKKMLRKGAFTQEHFDHDLNFHATEEDPVTKKTIKRMILNIKPKDIGSIISGSPGEDPKMLLNFKDLLDKMFTLDPDKRLTVSQALNHPFITGK